MFESQRFTLLCIPQDIYPDLAIERTILDFIVKCPNERYGCQWTEELRSIEVTFITSKFLILVSC